MLAPNHPLLTTPKREISLAEGVFCAVEVKPDISQTREFDIALNQIRSVKKLTRKTFTDIPGITRRRAAFENLIPGVVFSAKSLKPGDLWRYLYRKVHIENWPVEELPDIIFTLDNGLYRISRLITGTPFGSQLHTTDFKIMTHSESAMFHFISKKGEALAIFLIQLFSFPLPIMLSHEFILSDYLIGVEAFIDPYPLQLKSLATLKKPVVSEEEYQKLIDLHEKMITP